VKATLRTSNCGTGRARSASLLENDGFSCVVLVSRKALTASDTVLIFFEFLFYSLNTTTFMNCEKAAVSPKLQVGSEN